MNKSVLAIDFRNTPGFNDDIHKRIALILLKNIEKAFKRKQ
jgi:hypothetical protein